MKQALAALVPLLILSCARVDTKQITITGQVKGADGNVPVTADIHLGQLRSSISEPQLSQKIDDDGTFKMQVDSGGIYKLWVTAVNHNMIEIPIVLSSDDKEIQINVELAGYTYKDSFDEVKIIGDWNNFSTRNADAMTKQNDGTFVFETEIAADSVAYQLSGLLTGRHTVNGTMSHYYVYDGSGDYKSVLDLTNGKVSIVFDPEKLSHADNSNLPLITFDSTHDSQKYFFEIDQLADQERDAFRAYMRENGYPKEPDFDLSTLQERIKSFLAKNEEPALLQFAAANLLALLFYDIPVDEALCNQLILNHMPAESAMWSLRSYICEFIPRFVSQEEATTIWRQLAAKNPDRTVRAYASALLVNTAFVDNDERFNEMYHELKEQFGDVPDAQYFLDMLDPENPTAVGKLVPTFELTALGSKQKLSNESFLGKYYLIDFWAVWCPPCRVEMPNLHQVYEKYKDRNFTILSLSLDDKPENIVKYRKENWPMPWNHAYLGRSSWGTGVTKDFNLKGIPKPLLISPEGVILATTNALTGDELDRTLTKYLKAN